jgi:FixJ family two-component response regulator
LKLSSYGCAEAQEPLVIILDDDASMCAAVSSLLRSVGMRVQIFNSAREILDFDLPDVPSCLVLDVRLPGLGGLELQSQLNSIKVHLPIIFITGHGDVPMTVKAMKAGAVDFLTKPFRDQDLLDAVSSAIEIDRKYRAYVSGRSAMVEHYATLSGREQEVMGMAVCGLMNKQIADRLSLSEITVKMHRAHAMQKMKARTFADLVKMAEALSRDS